MNIKYLFTIYLLLFLSINGYSQTKKIVLLHTNDTHSHIEPLDSTDHSYPNCGGIALRQAYVENVRASEKNVLVFDAGDFSQGTIYYNIFGGQIEIECMNMIGYDAVTLGNHEFDSGLENLRKILLKAQFPVVCTNYDVSKTCLKKCIKPYHIIKKGRLRIGIIGLGTRLEGIVQKKNYNGINFIDPYEIAERTALFLKEKKKCDLIVCLSHLGLDKNSFNDSDLAKKTSAIDIILGGHTHTFMEAPEFVENARGHKVLISQAGENGVLVGRVDITFSSERLDSTGE